VVSHSRKESQKTQKGCFLLKGLPVFFVASRLRVRFGSYQKRMLKPAVGIMFRSGLFIKGSEKGVRSMSVDFMVGFHR
jgi:hypothetical protein